MKKKEEEDEGDERVVPEGHYCIKGNSTWPETKLNDDGWYIYRSLAYAIAFVYILTENIINTNQELEGTRAKDE
jgi:hypothetical protein